MTEEPVTPRAGPEPLPDDTVDASSRTPSPSASREWLGPRLSLRAVAVGVAIVLVVLWTYSLLRIAGEQHYQSCVVAAVGKNQGTDNLTRLVRRTSVNSCSRSPF
jgi:hypothetical protein